MNNSETVNKVYDEVSRFILLGLTGRTGSGCTTAADFLCTEKINIPSSSDIYTTVNDRKKYSIINNYLSNNWSKFISIRVTTIITKTILCLDFYDLLKYLSEILGEDIKVIEKKFINFKIPYEDVHSKVVDFDSMPDIDKGNEEIKNKIDKAWELYFDILPTFTQTFKTWLQDSLGVDSYVKLYQASGDNVRASGKANVHEFAPDNLFLLPRIINKLIQVAEEKVEGKVFIVIDAIRNPYEAEYFKQRYANFFLLAINTPNEERLKHLRRSHKFTDEQIKKLDKKEYPEKLSGKDVFVSQNIQKCIEAADIHINNPNRNIHNISELRSQLVWYVSLILHPGLVTPTATERCMQFAFSSKINSGCISRQVGAVVADVEYSIKAIGWNSVPHGQTPCLLRSAKELMNDDQRETYSDYEKTNNEFRVVLKQSFSGALDKPILKGRNLPFCFKDLQNEVEGEKNQVHTRSLHAEENAFLQLAKYGGQPIKGGVLFSTASPCELCSKKAYQLGISKIFYIDPYPGIANDHILKCGSNVPKLILFSGAIGRAYHRLYQPVMSFKDEIRLLTEHSISGGVKKHKKDQKIKRLEDEVARLKNMINKSEID